MIENKVIHKLADLDSSHQAIVRIHDDPVEYDQRIVNARYALPQLLAEEPRLHIAATESIFDIGCGTGIVRRTLRDRENIGHTGRSYAVDISTPMVEYVIERNLYDIGLVGSAVDAADFLIGEVGADGIDWAIALSSTYYMKPSELTRLLPRLYLLCRRGIILSFDGVTEKFTQAMSESAGANFHFYDHRNYFSCHAVPTALKLERVYSGYGWHSVATGGDIPADVVVLR